MFVRQQTDKAGKLMVAFADDFKEVGEVGPGNIAVISGLRHRLTYEKISLKCVCTLYWKRRNVFTISLSLFSLPLSLSLSLSEH